MAQTEKLTAFDHCLEQIAGGESLEAVLDQYPEWRDEFRSSLEGAQAAMWLAQDRTIPISAQMRSKERFLLSARTARAANPGKFLYLPEKSKQRRTGFGLRLGFSFVLILSLIIAGALSVISVSASSLPGEPLHPLKILTENTRLWFERDPAKRMDLVKEFDIERETEFNSLVQKPKGTRSYQPVEIKLVGELIRGSGNIWTIDKVEVTVSPDTKIVGQLVDGYIAIVDGILQEDGSILVDQIELRQYEFSGELNQLGDQWQVSRLVFSLTPETVIQGELHPGARVYVILIESAEGLYAARFIRIDQSASSSQNGQREMIKTPETPEVLDDDKGTPGQEEGNGEDHSGEKKDEEKKQTPKPVETEEKEPEDDHEGDEGTGKESPDDPEKKETETSGSEKEKKP